MVKQGQEQRRDAIPRDLHANAYENEGDDAEDSVHGGLRDGARDARRVRIADVDKDAEDDDGEKESAMTEQVLSKVAAFVARCERERDDEGARARR